MSILVSLGLLEPRERVRIASDCATVVDTVDEVRVIPVVGSNGATVRYWIDGSTLRMTNTSNADESLLLAAYPNRRVARRALAGIAQRRIAPGSPERKSRWMWTVAAVLLVLWFVRPSTPVSSTSSLAAPAPSGIGAPVEIVGIPSAAVDADPGELLPLPADVTCSGVR